MKRQVVLAAGAPAAAHGELIAALAAAGERAGWLDLAAAAAHAGELQAAAEAGAFRAVAVAPGKVATLKPIRGQPVLTDLLREHFRGCLLVLVRGVEGLIRLDPDAAGWQLTAPSGRRLRRSTAELVADLGRPAVWRRLGGEGGAGGEPPPAAAD